MISATLDAILASLGLTKGSALGGFFGAVISLRFLEGLSWWKRLSTVIAGTFVAAYVTPLIVLLFDLNVKVESGVAFLVGVFGMSLAGAVIKAIPDIIKAVNERISK